MSAWITPKTPMRPARVAVGYPPLLHSTAYKGSSTNPCLILLWGKKPWCRGGPCKSLPESESWVHTRPPHVMRKKRKKVRLLAFLITGRFRLTQIALWRTKAALEVAPFPDSPNADTLETLLSSSLSLCRRGHGGLLRGLSPRQRNADRPGSLQTGCSRRHRRADAAVSRCAGAEALDRAGTLPEGDG